MNIVELLEFINDPYDENDEPMPEEAQIVLNDLLELDSKRTYRSFEDMTIYDIDLDDFVSEFSRRSVELSIDGNPITLVDNYGGEGMGDEYWAVLECNGVYARIRGWYSSWDGGSYDSVQQVIPREEKIIRFYDV